MLTGQTRKLNFPMFLSIITEMLIDSKSLSTKLREAFEVLDEDGTGFIKMSTLEEAVPGISDKVDCATFHFVFRWNHIHIMYSIGGFCQKIR